MKNKNMKTPIVLIFIVIILAGAVSGLVYNTIQLNGRLKDLEEKGAAGAAQQPVANPVGNNETVIVDPAKQGVEGSAQQKSSEEERMIEVSITDQGFIPAGFQFYTDEKIILSVKNEGQSSHSFASDSLGVDAVSINPGETVTVAIDKKFDEMAAADFYSKTGEDNFKGVAMILKR